MASRYYLSYKKSEKFPIQIVACYMKAKNVTDEP